MFQILFNITINYNSSKPQKKPTDDPEPERAPLRVILINSLRESLKTMVLRTSTWTILLYVVLIITFSGNNANTIAHNKH